MDTKNSPMEKSTSLELLESLLKFLRKRADVEAEFAVGLRQLIDAIEKTETNPCPVTFKKITYELAQVAQLHDNIHEKLAYSTIKHIETKTKSLKDGDFHTKRTTGTIPSHQGRDKHGEQGSHYNAAAGYSQARPLTVQELQSFILSKTLLMDKEECSLEPYFQELLPHVQEKFSPSLVDSNSSQDVDPVERWQNLGPGNSYAKQGTPLKFAHGSGINKDKMLKYDEETTARYCGSPIDDVPTQTRSESEHAKNLVEHANNPKDTKTPTSYDEDTLLKNIDVCTSRQKEERAKLKALRRIYEHKNSTQTAESCNDIEKQIQESERVLKTLDMEKNRYQKSLRGLSGDLNQPDGKSSASKPTLAEKPSCVTSKIPFTFKKKQVSFEATSGHQQKLSTLFTEANSSDSDTWEDAPDYEQMPKLCRALHDFDNYGYERAIPMRKNDMFYIEHMDMGSGWTTVRHKITNQQGEVPTSYLENI